MRHILLFLEIVYFMVTEKDDYITNNTILVHIIICTTIIIYYIEHLNDEIKKLNR